MHGKSAPRLLVAALAALCALPLVTACGADGAADQATCTQPGDIDCSSDVPGTGNKSDAWNYVNDPARFARNLVYRIDDLPKEGRAARQPWASTYWPTYQDATNVRWQGAETLSPLEKYDLAFNGWKPADDFMSLRPLKTCGEAYDASYYANLGPAAQWMSDNRGNIRMRDGKDNDKDGKKDECDEDDESGDSDFDGIQTWWGLCHAWVPASILEEEPQAAVTFNGVTFEVSDITALLITAYDSAHSLYIGNRCTAQVVTRDPQTNRITDKDCRDTNAGAFHVVAANLLGLRKIAFAEDRTFNLEVWNQPVVGFSVSSMEEVTKARANELLENNDGDVYKANPKAVTLVEVEATLQYITESWASTEPTSHNIEKYTEEDEYHYLLELDKDRKIIGGEWLDYAQESHPDFLWMPVGAGKEGRNPHVDLAQLHRLLALAREGAADAGEGGTDGGVSSPSPDSMCLGAYTDANGHCRRANGFFAPAVCCQ